MGRPAPPSRHGHQPVRAGDPDPRATHPRPRQGATTGHGGAGGLNPAAGEAGVGARHARRVASWRARARHRRAAVIRPAVAADCEAMAAIWNYEVLHTTATTDTEPRSLQAQHAWLAAHGPRYPVIVAVDGGEVVAFGALSPYRPKPAYAWTAENSVYVKDGWRGKGLGGGLLDRLLLLAREHGHRSVIARITASNEA